MITGHTDHQPGRSQAGCKAGQLSQAGYILKLMTESLVEQGEEIVHLSAQLAGQADTD